MNRFVIEGGIPLQGEVKISGSKNACLPIIAATLLAPGKHIIHNIPQIRDIRTMLRILELIGSKVELLGHTLSIDTSLANNPYAPYELISTMRASFLITGAMIGRFGEAHISRPGGCAIGPRPIDEHLHGFKMLGIKIKEEHGYLHLSSNHIIEGKVYLNEQSVTATENILLATATQQAETHIINGAMEPHVMELIKFLNLMGANIKLKDDIIIVIGNSLHPIEYTISADYIETGTFIIATAITGGEVTLIDAKYEDSIAEITKLQEIGVQIEKVSNGIKVKMSSPIKSCNIKTAPYPGFPTDLQPQITSLLAIANGTSIITETMYEQRFNHILELARMGAEIEIEGRNAIITGVKELSGTKVMASDIRGGASLVIAGLAANGITEISRIYHIDRGYESLETKLSQLGAKIKRV
ncbi:MAG: UDP-N-acetylglucosamine 1-carboxyvinyltransferase [Candidatus Stahlbacteria bacterium]|nr:UDP-N-acetylglucosamine 1-carboxyvinyltransferase [Candidatus Stahlbacteria bacterium]